MSVKHRDPVSKVADNALLVLAARAVSVIGVPIALAVFYWLANTVNATQVATAVHEQRLSAIEQHWRDMDGKLDRILERLAQ